MHPTIFDSNIRYQDGIHPVAFIALAFFAGSKRYIHYFKGASRPGLFLSAALSGVTTIYYDHKIRIRRESCLETFLGKGLCISLATLTTSFLLKNLHTRISLPSRGALYFVTLQMLPLGLISTAHPRPLKTPPSSDKTHTKKPTLPPSPMYRQKYDHYKNALPKWQSLSTDERTALAHTFHKHRLPALSLFQAPIHPWETEEAALSKESREQLTWHIEILQHHPDFSRNLTSEKLLHYNHLFVSKGLGILHCPLHKGLRILIDKNEAYAEMYYAEFQRHPEFFFVQEDKESLRKIVSYKQESADFSFDRRLHSLSSQEIPRMDRSLIEVWHHILSQEKQIWSCFDLNQQQAFNTRFIHFQLTRIPTPTESKERKGSV